MQDADTNQYNKCLQLLCITLVREPALPHVGPWALALLAMSKTAYGCKCVQMTEK